MNDRPGTTGRWSVVVVYAVAMAWVEAAVVYYLRTMVNRIEPHQPNPLPLMGGIDNAELVREAATLVMLLTAGILAGRNWRSRLGYAAVAFGFWDIFYYIFLKILCGWPHSVWDWDILFLLPLPWWGPVLAPALISVLMILWGTLVSRESASNTDQPGEGKAWIISGLGVVLALYVFMADTVRVAGQGAEAVRNVLPVTFNWASFCVALSLMSAPVGWELSRVLIQARRKDGPALVFQGGENKVSALIPGTETVETADRCSSESRPLVVAAVDRNLFVPEKQLPESVSNTARNRVDRVL